MKGTQLLSRRERDLNTQKQFFRSLGVSAVAHAAFILGIIIISEWGYKPKIIVPGYMVNLVTLDSVKPHSLLDSPKPELKKKNHGQVKKKKAVIPRKKTSVAKKIVPKKKKKQSLKPKKKAVAILRPKQDLKQKTTVPRKTIVTEGAAFPHIWYLKIVERKVKEHWITHGMDTAGQRSDPVVRFRIGRDGMISEQRLERSSGSEILDISSISAVTNAQPFPPLPEDYPEDSLVVHFGFSYEQHEQ